MPVPIARLRQIQRPLTERIVEFLKHNPGQAYNLSEIWKGVEFTDADGASFLPVIVIMGMTPEKRTAVYEPYREAVSKLLSEGTIVAATVDEDQYYYLANENRG